MKNTPSATFFFLHFNCTFAAENKCSWDASLLKLSPIRSIVRNKSGKDKSAVARVPTRTWRGEAFHEKAFHLPVVSDKSSIASHRWSDAQVINAVCAGLSSTFVFSAWPWGHPHTMLVRERVLDFIWTLLRLCGLTKVDIFLDDPVLFCPLCFCRDTEPALFSSDRQRSWLLLCSNTRDPSRNYGEAHCITWQWWMRGPAWKQLFPAAIERTWIKKKSCLTFETLTLLTGCVDQC